MSSYRDDTTDTAIASDFTVSTLRTITTELAKVADATLFGLLVVLGSSAVVADEIPSTVFVGVEESAIAGDLATGTLHATNLATDGVVVGDRFFNMLSVLHSDSVTASDAIPNGVLALSVDVVSASDTLICTRKTAALFQDSATVSDKTFAYALSVTDETAQVRDNLIQSSRSTALITESAVASDILLGAHTAVALAIVEMARAVDSLPPAALYAKTLITDTVIVEDAALAEPTGQAWTANTESWAMSRYTQYAFDNVAVINGVMYGMNDDGVYVLDGGVDTINGALVFGRLDLGGGKGLVHPTHAYLEYEKTNGAADMDVTTTQSGAAELFTYSLANEAANQLTNGRFIFGKGLRGRHFQFSLRLNAEKAYINDLVISAAPTQRRT